MDAAPYLAMHILNRVWSRLLSKSRFDEMHVIEELQNKLMDEFVFEADLIGLLGYIRFWCEHHEVPEVE